MAIEDDGMIDTLTNLVLDFGSKIVGFHANITTPCGFRKRGYK
jgi:hypothetical protein